MVQSTDNKKRLNGSNRQALYSLPILSTTVQALDVRDFLVTLWTSWKSEAYLEKSRRIQEFLGVVALVKL